MRGPVVVGVDGGATRSRAVVVDGDGGVLGRALGGPAVARETSPHEAADTVEAVVRSAAGDAGVELPLVALWAGLAGAGRKEARQAVEARLDTGELARTVQVGTDVEAAFHDAFGGGAGILLVAGTGSVGSGRAEDGRTGRVGGWGSLLGDEGSAYRMAVQALRAVVREADGRGPATRLSPVLLQVLELEEASGIIPWLEQAGKAEVAGLAPAVVRLAEEGDPAASTILAVAVEALREHLFVLMDRLGPWRRSPDVALTGGLLDPGGPLRPRVAEVVRGLGARPRDRAVDAALGAARLALELDRSD